MEMDLNSFLREAYRRCTGCVKIKIISMGYTFEEVFTDWYYYHNRQKIDVRPFCYFEYSPIPKLSYVLDIEIGFIINVHEQKSLTD